ncbi:MAG: DUF1697 domain-containing protein [Alphaproteobacteria bacterium]|nr:DUF1697 domain-containing protein [Alphaproteobacteria bacterium]MBU0802571.1 DUF1697 domain-containing protein [Alphaproteobacteria bacterium]MBU0871368.1 DUF1697 domain-containing protein [Alphaproteobacteria bacterium]MBU1400035.1 DUF1697 domain-containing protein [Alphaproteobacteria bacterium]MBU1591155.1 DUF1697 domain-containing protein [Alphaproteobacteria bacterium]
MSGTVFIVLFRGVGGATQLPVAPLRAALTEEGFGSVETYINSGNAVLASGSSAIETRRRVASIVKERFGFEKDIMLVSRAEWADLVTRNPFPEAVGEPTTLHAFVLADVPEAAAIAALEARATGRERLVVDGRTLYFHVPDGFGRSKLPPVIDRVLGVASTARNWRTVMALDRMAQAT